MLYFSFFFLFFFVLSFFFLIFILLLRRNDKPFLCVNLNLNMKFKHNAKNGLNSCSNVFGNPTKGKQDAQLSQTDRAAGCVIVFARSRRLELGDKILHTL